jgi:RNA polymerase sigma-70 factor (ECF subfamily)
METPVSILERLRRADDPLAWVDLVEVVTPFLYQVARRHGLRPDDAADVAQDVLVVLAQELPRFEYDPARSFVGWLRTVLRNRLYDLRKRRQPLVMAPADLPEPTAPWEPFDEREYTTWLAARALALVETRCSATEKAVVREYIQKGRAAAEVAAELGVSANVVYLTSSRVVARLRGLLAGMLE